MADAPPPPPGTAIEDDAPAPPRGTSVEPPPPPGTEVESGSPLLKAAGSVASFLPRLGRAVGVGAQTLIENAPPTMSLRGQIAGGLADDATRERALAAGREAFKPGYQPKPGEKIGAALGSMAGAAPEIMAAGELVPAFLPEAPALAPLARVALARAAHSAAVFGLTNAADTTAEQAALTGRVDPMQSLKAAAGGAVMGAGLGAAGAVPALVSGKLPEAVTKVLSDEVASRIFGASVAGAVGAGAAAVGGGTKEDIAAHGAGFFLMDILGNAQFDAQYKQAAKDSAIKPIVDAMVGSGMEPQQAVTTARGMLENVLKETGHASQVIRESPQYQEAVKFMTGEYLKANPGMEPIGAETLARRRIDVAFASGEMTIAELKKLNLKLAPAPAEGSPEAPGAAQEPAGGPPALPVPEGSSAGPQAPPETVQPGPGDRVVVPSEGGHVEGRVIGYDHETGAPRVEVTGAHGEAPAGEIGDIVTAPAESIHVETPAEEEPSGVESKLVRGPAPTLSQMTPDEFKSRFKGVARDVYVKALAAHLEGGRPIPPEAIDAHPELRDLAKEKEITARWQDLADQGLAGHEQPVMDLIRKRGGIDIKTMKDAGEYGELRSQDLLNRGLARHGGAIKGWDEAARLAHEAGLIPEQDKNMIQEAILSEARKGTKGELVRDASASYEAAYPEEFPPRPKTPNEGWFPERTKAALDAAGVKTGGPVTSHGFLDPDHGRIKRGEKGVLLGTDLENGRLLVDFGGRVIVADPRDISETYKADQAATPAERAIREVPERLAIQEATVERLSEALKAAPEGRDRDDAQKRLDRAEEDLAALKKVLAKRGERTSVVTAPETRAGVEAKTGVTDPDEEILHLAESEVLRIQLLNQQKGSIVAAQAVRRQMLGQFSQQLRAGKDIRKTLAMFTREALTGLKVNNVAAGKLLNTIATAKNDHDFVQALLRIEETINGAYSKELVAEIKQVWGRAQGAPGVEVGWQKRMRDAFSDIRFTTPNERTVDRAQAQAEFIAQAVQAGRGGEVPAHIRENTIEALKRPLASLSIPELEELRDTMLSLEKTGRQAQKFKELAQAFRRLRLVQQMTTTGKPIERADVAVRRPGDPQLPIRARVRNSIGTDTDFWQDKGRAILAPHVMFDMADGDMGYQGGHSRALEVLNSAYHDAAQLAHEILKPIHATIEALKITPEEYEKTAIVLIRNQEGGLKHLLGDRWLGATEEAREKYVKSIKLDDRQRKLGEALLAVGRDQALFKAIADDIRARQNREVKKVDGWYPFVNNYSRFGDMPLNERLADAFENRFARREVAHGYTIERQGGKTALRYDLSAFEKIVHDIAYQVKAGQSMELFSRAVNSQQYERAMGPFWTKWMRQYATLLASRGGTEGARRSEMIQKVTRNMATFALGWRVASAFSHVGLLPLGANEIGWGPVSWGLRNYGRPEFAKFLTENVPEFRESTRSAAALEAVRALNQPANARGGAFNVYDSARRMFAGSVALGAYKHWHEQRGLDVDWSKPNKNALLYAAAIMTRTQGSPLYKDVPLALSAGAFSGNVDLDRAALQFKQPILARWSYFVHDIKHLGWDAGNKADAAEKLANLMAGEALEFGVKYAWKGVIGAIIGGLFGAAYAHRKDSLAEEGKKFAEHVAGTIPFVDNLMQMGLHGRTGIPALDTIQSIPRGIVSAAQAMAAGHRAKELHATVDALSGLAAVAAGIPGGSIAAEIAHKSISASGAGARRNSVPHAPRPPRPK